MPKRPLNNASAHGRWQPVNVKSGPTLACLSASACFPRSPASLTYDFWPLPLAVDTSQVRWLSWKCVSGVLNRLLQTLTTSSGSLL